MKASQLVRALERGETLQHESIPEYVLSMGLLSKPLSEFSMSQMYCLASLIVNPAGWSVAPKDKLKTVLTCGVVQHTFDKQADAARFLKTTRQHVFLAIARGAKIKGYKITQEK